MIKTYHDFGKQHMEWALEREGDPTRAFFDVGWEQYKDPATNFIFPLNDWDEALYLLGAIEMANEHDIELFPERASEDL